MAYVSTNTEVRLTDDMERRLVNQMVREKRGGVFAGLKKAGAAVTQCAVAFGAFLDAYAETVDEAGRRASHHGYYI